MTTVDQAPTAAAGAAGRSRFRRTPGASARLLAGRVAERFALLLVCLGAWELFARWVDNPVLPDVEQLWRTALQTCPTAAYWQAIGLTLSAWALGLAIAIAIAIPVGLIVGSSPLVNRLTRATFDFLRTVPLIMLVPLFVLIFGTTTRMKVVVVVLSTLWPLLLQTAYGIREVDRVAKETVRSYRLRWRDRVRFLYLPSAAPFAATGLRIAAVTGLLVTVGAEIITSAPGIGFDISLAQANAEPAASFVYVLTAALLGLLINATFSRVERAVMFWHPAQRRSGARTARAGTR